MGLSPASVNRASIQATFIPGEVSPLSIPEILNLPVCFQNVSNLKKDYGTYTPNDDTQTIHTFSPTDQANFILLIVDQPTVVDLNSNLGEPVARLCVQRFLYTGLQTLPSGLLDLVLDGSAAGPEVPMTQNIPCNWTLYWGVASLS
jgi:hypothetical protein